MTRTSDNDNLDESEEVYNYLICAICPVALSKPGLGYLESEGRIGSRVRDWVVGVPDTAFIFPAFTDRSTDIHSTLFYTKNTKEPHSEFMANGLGCGVERTATEQKMAFHSIVRNVLGAEDEHTEDILMDIQQNLSDMIEEYEETHDEDADAFVLDKETLGKLLEECNVPEDKANRIEKSVDEAFGEKAPIAEHVIDAKALVQNEIRLEQKEMESQIVTLNKQLEDKNSLLNFYRRLIKIRNQNPVIARGELDEVFNFNEPKITAYSIESDDEEILIVHNFSENEEKILDLSKVEIENAVLRGDSMAFDFEKNTDYNGAKFVKLNGNNLVLPPMSSAVIKISD
jgi:hypothetical protein